MNRAASSAAIATAWANLPPVTPPEELPAGATSTCRHCHAQQTLHRDTTGVTWICERCGPVEIRDQLPLNI